MIKNSIIFIVFFYLSLLITSTFMESVFPRIKLLLSNDEVSYQNWSSHTSKPIDVKKNFPSQKSVFFTKDGGRNDVYIDVQPGSHYPYRLDLINSLQFYPLSGLSNQKVSLCNELGYWPVIKNDKFGNNNKIQIDEAEVIFFGDSFGEAGCVNQEDSIQATMTSLKVPTYSFSNGGVSLLTAAASFFEHIELASNSKKVIYLYFVNDTGNLKGILNEASNPFLSKYLEKGYRQKNYIKNYLKENNQKKMRNYSELKIIQNADNSWNIPNADRPPLAFRIMQKLKLSWYKKALDKTNLFNSYIYRHEKEYMESLLYRMKVKSEKLGKEFFISSIPMCSNRYGQLPKFKNNSNFNTSKVDPGLAISVKDIAFKLNIRTIDLSSAFKDCNEYNERRPNIINSPSGIHFDEKGYQMLGKELIKKLKSIN